MDLSGQLLHVQGFVVIEISFTLVSLSLSLVPRLSPFAHIVAWLFNVPLFLSIIRVTRTLKRLVMNFQTME